MGRVPPKEYTNAPRGGLEQIMEKLPPNGQPDTIAISNSDPNDNIELAINPEKRELERMVAVRNAKSYFVFAFVMTVLGWVFSLVSMLSCSFGVVHWAVDGSSSAYQSGITHMGLWRWYNPKTASCWAYSPDDADFFYVDKVAQGLAAAAVFFGALAGVVALVMLIANMMCCVRRGKCSRFDLNSTSQSNIFFSLSGLTVLSSILQICTLTYFKKSNVPDYVITCNGNEDSTCTISVGASFAIVAFIFYLLAGFVYAMAGVGCRLVEETNNNLEDSMPPPPPPPLPPTSQSILNQQRPVSPQADDESGPPPPAPSAQFAAFPEDDSMQSV